MLITPASEITSADITPYPTYLQRRQVLRGATTSLLAAGAAGLVAGLGGVGALAQTGAKLEGVRKSPLSTDETLTPYNDVTQYNNFYEFGTDRRIIVLLRLESVAVSCAPVYTQLKSLQ